MAKNNNNGSFYIKKKTAQGSGTFTRDPAAGGERYTQGFREGTPPSKARRRKKPYKGQGR